ADILSRVSGKKTNFGDLASQGSEYSAENLLALTPAFLGKGKFEIPQADAAQLKVDRKDDPCDHDSGSPCQRSGQRANDLYKDPRKRVFESVAQRKADGSIREICLSNEETRGSRLFRKAPPRATSESLEPRVSGSTYSRSLPTSPDHSE